MKLRVSLKKLEEDALPIARLLVSHVAGKQVQPLVDRLKEAPPRALGDICQAFG
jgi:hypothetical protein